MEYLNEKITIMIAGREDRKKASHICRGMSYGKSEEEYEENWGQLKGLLRPEQERETEGNGCFFLEYFRKNWHTLA